jgi:hypothetical protein
MRKKVTILKKSTEVVSSSNRKINKTLRKFAECYTLVLYSGIKNSSWILALWHCDESVLHVFFYVPSSDWNKTIGFSQTDKTECRQHDASTLPLFFLLETTHVVLRGPIGM